MPDQGLQTATLSRPATVARTTSARPAAEPEPHHAVAVPDAPPIGTPSAVCEPAARTAAVRPAGPERPRSLWRIASPAVSDAIGTQPSLACGRLDQRLRSRPRVRRGGDRGAPAAGSITVPPRHACDPEAIPGAPAAGSITVPLAPTRATPEAILGAPVV